VQISTILKREKGKSKKGNLLDNLYYIDKIDTKDRLTTDFSGAVER